MTDFRFAQTKAAEEHLSYAYPAVLILCHG